MAASSAILTKLVREISVSQSECRYRHREVTDCVEQISRNYNIHGITVGAAASIVPSRLTEAFHRSVTEIRKVPYSDCQASWKDMLVYTCTPLRRSLQSISRGTVSQS